MRHLLSNRRLQTESLSEMMQLFVVAGLLLWLLLWLHLI
jgi:hypothetical protein